MDVFNSHEIVDSNTFLYHYTKFDTAINKIIENKTLMLNTFDRLNDPRESKEWGIGISNVQPGQNEINPFDLMEKINEELKFKWKILCMVQDVENSKYTAYEKVYYRGYSHPRMWAQYADSHRGVCLIFDKEKLSKSIIQSLDEKGILYSDSVQYNNFSPLERGIFQFDYNELTSRNLGDLLDEHLKKYYQALFFLKKKDWKHENEWRWVFYDESKEPFFVNYDDSLIGIIHGCDCKNYLKKSDKLKDEGIRTGIMCWDRGHPGISEFY